MNQMPSRKIDFRKQRDFSAVFSDSFKFYKQNFKILALAIMILLGPIIVITAGIQGYLQSQGVVAFTLFNLKSIGYYLNGEEINYYFNLIQFLLTGILSIFSLAIITRYFVLYQAKNEGEEISIQEIMKYFLVDSWRLFYNYLLFMLFVGLIGVGLYVIFQVPVLNWILGVLGFLLVLPNLYYLITASFYLVIRDQILITEAFRKVSSYMRGNYWWTWLTVVTSLFSIGIIGLIFTLPYLIFIMVKTFSRTVNGVSEVDDNSLVYIVLAVVAAIGSHILTPIFNTFCNLHYHSHEEAEEGTGLKSRIDEIGLNN